MNEMSSGSDKLVDLLNKHSGGIDSTKELIIQCRDSVQKDFQAQNSQLKEYLINEFKNQYLLQNDINNNICNLEKTLQDSLTQLSEKIDKNGKINKGLLITIIVLMAMALLYSICL